VPEGVGGWVRELARGVLDLVYAPICVACGAAISPALDERLVCGRCWSLCLPIPLPRCRRCWHPLRRTAEPGAVCTECESLPPALRVVRSAFVLSETSRSLVHALKYRGWHALGRAMGRRMARLDVPQDVRDEARLVVPVPIGRARLRERGYNQAERLADGVAAHLGLALRPTLLQRSRFTGSQTALHPTERRANVAGAFRVDAGERESITGEHVLLVDDVWTTGATALECTSALLAAGARAVSVLTFARALPVLERAASAATRPASDRDGA
jgi:ComF family protein